MRVSQDFLRETLREILKFGKVRLNAQNTPRLFVRYAAFGGLLPFPISGTRNITQNAARDATKSVM
jgi:hypothetical protein